jgi:hypothetical protein
LADPAPATSVIGRPEASVAHNAYSIAGSPAHSLQVGRRDGTYGVAPSIKQPLRLVFLVTPIAGLDALIDRRRVWLSCYEQLMECCLRYVQRNEAFGRLKLRNCRHRVIASTSGSHGLRVFG